MFYQGQIKNHVLRTELYGKIESESLIADVLEALPIKVENTLFNFRTKLLGKVPRTRDEYDPTTFLHTLSGGEKITVLDSKDLPEKWTEYNIKALFENPVGEDEPVEDEEPDVRRPSNPGVQPVLETTIEEELEQTRSEGVGRVLVFTTIRLLGLLTLCLRGSIDGTFRSVTKLWRQILILMVEYNGLFIPIAFGWLPDKSAISYYVFMWLLLKCFKDNENAIAAIYGRRGLRLRKLKCDFEPALHIGFESFHLSGCYFHFSQVISNQVIFYCHFIYTL